MKYLRAIFCVLTVICLIYSVSIYMVGSGTFSFAIWLVGAALFGCAWFFAGDDRWMKVPAVLRGAGYCFIIVALIVFTVCMTAMLSHFGDKGVKDLDYIVVLGAQMRENGPSIIFKYRLDEAYEYLLDNPETICGATGWENLREMTKTSIWMIHAADDMIVKASYKTDGNIVHLGSRDIYDELKDIHPDLHYTEYKAGELKERFGINPHCSWVPAGEDEEVKEWLFSRFK